MGVGPTDFFSSSMLVVVVTVMAEFLCLCFRFLRRDVRLSSSGFMSGGMLAILRNMTTRKKSRKREITCMPPVAVDTSQVVFKILSVDSATLKSVRQRPLAPGGSRKLLCAMIAVNV